MFRTCRDDALAVRPLSCERALIMEGPMPHTSADLRLKQECASSTSCLLNFMSTAMTQTAYLQTSPRYLDRQCWRPRFWFEASVLPGVFLALDSPSFAHTIDALCTFMKALICVKSSGMHPSQAACLAGSIVAAKTSRESRHLLPTYAIFIDPSLALID